MINTATLNKISVYRDRDNKLLSVYLGSDTKKAPSIDALISQLHSMVHSHFTKPQKAEFEPLIAKIEDYLKTHTPSSRTIVFFVSDSFWEVATFEFSLEPIIRVAEVAYTAPINDAIFKYSMYLVLLVDREKIKMFTVQQGEIINHYEHKDESVPQRTKSTGSDQQLGRTDKNFNHNEELLKRHIEKLAKKVVEFTREKDIHFIIIGGHSEMFKKVEKSLPAGLRSKIMGRFVTEINIPYNDILNESKQIARTIEVGSTQ